MKVIYSKLNETEPQITMEPETDLNEIASPEEIEELHTNKKLHHIIEKNCMLCNLKLTDCSYDYSRDLSDVEFEFHIQGELESLKEFFMETYVSIRNPNLAVKTMHGLVYGDNGESNYIVDFNMIPEASAQH